MNKLNPIFKNVRMLAFVAISVMAYFSAANAQNWQNTNGPWLANARDFAIGRSGGTTTLYEVDAAKVYRSTNGAADWTATASLGSTPTLVACKPDAPATMYVAIDNYLKKSTNSGDGWVTPNPINDDQVFYAKSIAVSPASSGYMFVGLQKASQHTSMRRSDNSGTSWSTVGYFYDTVQTHVTAIAPHPTSYQSVWAGGTSTGDPPIESTTNFYLPNVVNGIFYSSNAGVSWITVGLGKNITALAVYVTASNTYVVAATDESAHPLYYSTNATSGSATWTEATSYSGGLISDIYVDGNWKIYVASLNGVWSSTDNCANWTSQSCGGMYDNLSVKCIATDPGSNNTVYAGTSTTIYKSVNSGTNWTDAAKGITQMKVSAVAASNTRYLALSPSYPLVEKYSSPYWNSQGVGTSNCDRDFRGKTIQFKSTSGWIGFAAGYDYTAPYTYASFYRNKNTAGDNWEKVYTGTHTSGKLNGVLVDPYNDNSNNRIYIYGKEIYSSGTHYNFATSVDTGTNWEKTAINTGTAEVADVAVDSTVNGGSYSHNLYAAISSGGNGVWKSDDGGSSWSQLSNTEYTYSSVGLNKRAPEYLYAAKTGGGLFKTSTTTISWSQVRSDTVVKILPHPSYYTYNHFWVIGDNGRKIYKTADGGTNWTDVTANIPSTAKIYNLNRDLTNRAYIYCATDSGVYRIDPNPESPTNLVDATGASAHPVISWDANLEGDVSSYKIYKKRGDYGSYSYLATVSATSYTDNSEDIDNGGEPVTIYYYVKAVDGGGNLSGTSNVVGIVCTNIGDDKLRADNLRELPTEFALEQNYPNPFNPTTTIKFALPLDANVTLKIFDVSGKEIAVLINGLKSAGYYETPFDAAKLASGVYIYSLDAIGVDGKQFMATKKLVLMK